MIKKVSAIILALVLCLSAMVVPTSAAGFADDYQLPDGTNMAYKLEWDKEYYSAGDTAYLSVYIKAAPDKELFTGSFAIGLNTAVFSQTDNAAATIAASIEASDVWTAYWKKPTASQIAWQSSAIVSRITAKNTEAENALYDQYLKIGIARDTSTGTGEYATDNTRGLPTNDLNASTEAVLVIPLIVRSDLADGVAVNAAITTGTALCTPAQTAQKYYSNAGSTNSSANFAATSLDCANSAAPAAQVGKEPCADDAHVWDAGVVTTEPTCGEVGVKTYTCSVCKSTKTEDVAATGKHTEGEAVKENEVAATCKDAGSYESVVNCSVCGTEISRETVSVPATGAHVYAKEADRKEATCTEDGYVVMACGCGATETTTLPASGHTEETIPAVDATCTKDGATAGVKCSVCGEVLTAPETVPSAGHTEETVVENEVAATCTEDGSYESVVNCTVCDTEISRETVTVPATGHSYGEGKQTKSPSCTKAGETRYTCETCGYVDKRAEPAATGHTEYDVPAIEPTCLDAGFTEGTKCSKCNNYVVAPVRIPALGHTKTNGVVTEPTYSSQGYTTYVCDVCGDEYKTDIVNMKQVDFTVAIKDPSITEIRCKDTIVLHAITTDGGELPDDVTVVWTADNENFTTNEIEDGKLEITSRRKGNTVFTVTVYDSNGTKLSSDTVEMYSDAGFFKRIGGFFRTIFKRTAYYEY